MIQYSFCILTTYVEDDNCLCFNKLLSSEDEIRITCCFCDWIQILHGSAIDVMTLHCSGGKGLLFKSLNIKETDRSWIEPSLYDRNVMKSSLHRGTSFGAEKYFGNLLMPCQVKKMRYNNTINNNAYFSKLVCCLWPIFQPFDVQQAINTSWQKPNLLVYRRFNRIVGFLVEQASIFLFSDTCYNSTTLSNGLIKCWIAFNTSLKRQLSAYVDR